MAKRFTDTKKWAKEHFADLPTKMKLVWIYLCDNCDHAGVWDVNLRLMSFQIGEKIELNDIKTAFSSKIQFISPTKIFIPDFLAFQYGRLNPDNRVHKSVIDRLQKEGASKALRRALEGAKDKDKDKDKDEGECEGGITAAQLEVAYQEYPRKQGKTPGLKVARREIKTQEDLAHLRLAIKNYATNCERHKTERAFIKLFSSFMSEWRDWLDPETGNARSFASGGISGIANV